MPLQSFKLNNDFKRTAYDTGTATEAFDLYQDLNKPTVVLLVKLTTIGTATVETYNLTRVEDSAEVTTSWNNRASKTYVNLIDVLLTNLMTT
jgi:hypothetical protein